MSGKAIRETLAAVGVIASLVFVGVEIQQNTRSAEVDAYQNLIGQISELVTLTFENPEFGRLLREGAVFTEETTDLEDTQVDAYLWLLFRHGDMAFYQYERGLLSAERLRSALNPTTQQLRQPFAQEWWEARKSSFLPEYQNYLDNIIVGQCWSVASCSA